MMTVEFARQLSGACLTHLDEESELLFIWHGEEIVVVHRLDGIVFDRFRLPEPRQDSDVVLGDIYEYLGREG